MTNRRNDFDISRTPQRHPFRHETSNSPSCKPPMGWQIAVRTPDKFHDKTH